MNSRNDFASSAFITLDAVDNVSMGNEMFALMEKMYPICRSLTGEGVRQTLKLIEEHIPLQFTKVPSGTGVFDWVVPKEWNIRDAYVKNSKGEKIIDFQKSNLHVLNYSSPINGYFTLEELKKHLFTLPEYPEWIPYLTAYYKENWGFCLAYNQYKNLVEDTYEVCIDSTLKDGNLIFAETFIPGRRKEEVLLSTYFCHPSLCNDNLSGVVLLTFLAKYLSKFNLEYSYRFLFIPETIGAITWLSLNEKNVSKIKYGLVATCVGDNGALTYQKSRQGNSSIDKVVEKVLKDSGNDYSIKDFLPSGSDERQFCSPGFNLPIGSLMRTPYGCYPEYHTSADNLDFVSPEGLADSLRRYLETIYIIEHDKVMVNLNPKCEPQLGKRGLYRAIGGNKNGIVNELAMFWILNFSDGKNSLLNIATRSGIKFSDIKMASDLLTEAGLLKIREMDFILYGAQCREASAS